LRWRQAGPLPDVEGVDDEIELAVYGFQVSHTRQRGGLSGPICPF
jgi:hypothetical protein